jgi:hypothetical protein
MQEVKCSKNLLYEIDMKDIRNISPPQIVHAIGDIMAQEGINYGHTIPGHFHPCLWRHGDHS